MAIPKITDLVLYVTKAITGADWNTNWQKIITWLTGGSADVKFNSVDTNSVTTSGTITSNGATINGNADISGNLNVGGVISGDGSGLTGVQSVSTIAYTPFTVNKGYIDTTENSATYGQEILMEKDGSYPNIVNFRVPITATTSDGVTFTLEQLDDLNVDNYTDGTYIVCIKKNQQRAELKMGVYRQRLAPTDNSVPNNTLWLDTSTENIQCYEKLNNVWTKKYDGVPIGEVVVAGGEVDSVKTYHYNWNGYNVNVKDNENIFQVPGAIMRSWVADNIDYTTQQNQADWSIEYSNGYVEQGGRIFFNRPGSSTTGTLSLHIPITKFISLDSNEIENVSGVGLPISVAFYSFSSGVVTVKPGNHNQVVTGTMWTVKGYK